MMPVKQASSLQETSLNLEDFGKVCFTTTEHKKQF